MKRCYACKQDLPPAAFGRNKSRRDGLADECRDCHREVFRRVRAKDPEKYRENTRRWRALNPGEEKRRGTKKAWLAKNPGKNAEHCRNFRKAHPDKAAISTARWKRANPEKALDIALRGIRRYQARKMDALCACCAPISFKFIYLQARSLKMEVDHVQPLSKGGKHCLRNLQLLEQHDNRVKSARWAA